LSVEPVLGPVGSPELAEGLGGSAFGARFHGLASVRDFSPVDMTTSVSGHDPSATAPFLDCRKPSVANRVSVAAIQPAATLADNPEMDRNCLCALLFVHFLSSPKKCE
jgi:hypothetical protein